MIRVLIADDHKLVRQGIHVLLERAEDIEVVGEADDGFEALELAKRFEPDVVLLDISMPKLDGIQVLERMRPLQPSTKVVMLSMYSDDVLVRRALRLGARGYILKRSVAEEMLLAIRAATRDEIYLSPAVSPQVVAAALSPSAVSQATTPLEKLTPREMEVLALIARSKTNRQIAEEFSISAKTVDKHRTSIMSKLEVHNTAGLVRSAIRYGLVRLEE